jgi:hypothetical protein
MARELDFEDSWKYNVKAASTANVNLNFLYLPIIDSYQTKLGDRVLLKNQTDAKTNGIYVVNVNNLSQATDSIHQNSYEIGATVKVTNGNINALTEWYIAPIALANYNTTDKIWLQSTTSNAPEWAGQKQFLFIEEFDKNAVPQGWNSSVSGGSIVFNQQYETGSIGQAFLQAAVGAAPIRAGLLYGANFILDLSDCIFTKWYIDVRRAPTNTGYTHFGLANNNTSTPNAFGNCIVIAHDPLNMSGKNPGLITNWIIITNRTGFSFTTYDTGIAPTSAWQNFEFNFSNGLVPELSVKVNGIITNVITNMVNVPVVMTSGQSMGPTAYVGAIIGAVNTNSLRLNKFSFFRKWL